jgi:acetate kinase
MALVGLIPEAILVLNAGSSSLKASLIDRDDRTLAASATPWAGDGRDVAAAFDRVLSAAGIEPSAVSAVGHRVVHGGAIFTGPVRVTDAMVGRLAELRPLAPLHNALAEAVISGSRIRFPHLSHVASFDTAFHAGLPVDARMYPLPWSWCEDWGLRRFGFHGLSVQWAVHRAAELLERPAVDLGLVVAHLGSGCSVTAVWHGASMDTSMGMTPLEGLMMATRSGSIDPGLLLAVQRRHALSAADLEHVLESGSGLLGVAGTADMREVLDRSGRGDERASVALRLFVRRAAAGIAAAATALTRIDAIVFTGGIGERSAAVRDAVCARLATLSVGGRDGPAVLPIEAREDLIVAHEVRALLRVASPSG